MNQSIKALYRSKRPLVSVVPSTILKDEEGEEFDFLKFLRPSEPDKWMATNAQTGEPEDFLLHWAQAGGESKKPKPYAGQPTPLTEKERNDPTLFGRTKVLGEALPPRAVSQTELHGDRQREGKKAVQEKLPPHRPNAVEVATLDAFYTAYENLRKKFPLLKPDAIYNMDETGFEPDLPSNKEQVEFEVEWERFEQSSPIDFIWEPESNLQGYASLVREFIKEWVEGGKAPSDGLWGRAPTRYAEVGSW
ncbi:hypothetical protein T492DRAFT_869369 [Pavlovales sp. CCMP2436]|nr:hypothetical protein T492DRAFT_869369 [Pavlovales sp. CCMP2436]